MGVLQSSGVGGAVKIDRVHVIELSEYLNDLSMFIHCYQCNNEERYVTKINLSSIYLSRILHEYTPYFDTLESVLIEFIDMFNNIACHQVSDSMELLDSVVKDTITLFEYYGNNEVTRENRQEIYKPTVEAIDQVVRTVLQTDLHDSQQQEVLFF